ncbi:MAG: hypothetical protein ACTHK2_04445 [Dokdonella sp.]|uniref:hypothetical protein n=1 Tax=Dokdonella sp. TaxID=2291710 RepID=UPI003F8046E0
MTDVLVRRLLRTQVQQVVQTLTGLTVASPGVRPIAPREKPYCSLRTGLERKASGARAMPTFTTTTTLELSLFVAGSTDVDAQDQLEAWGQQVEQAVLAAPAFVQVLQQVAAITSEMRISDAGEAFEGELHMAIECETFEAFDPTVIDPAAYPQLLQMGVHVDTVRPFDANGVYLDPPFPDAVAPAPRTAGPDGRDEGALLVDLST